MPAGMVAETHKHFSQRLRHCRHLLGAVMLLPAFVACGGGGGGGGGDAAAQPPNASQAACPSMVKVQLFGDSTFWGYDSSTGGRASSTPDAVLQTAMDARFGAGRVTVETRAVSGSNSAQLLAGTDGLNLPWPRSATADIVVVNHGINDSRDHVALDSYRQQLLALANAAKFTGAALVFATPNPLFGWSFTSGEYAAAMRTVATQTGAGVADTYSYVEALPDWQRLLPDGAHPSAELYALIGRDVLAAALAPAVAQLLSCR
jgi:lysophospholipase L1-like esterase